MNHKNKKQDVVRALILVTQLGVNMLVPIFLCLFFGQWLDKLLGTRFLVIIFILLGILAAYRNLYVVLKPMVKGNPERKKEDEFEEKNQKFQ